jgi:hypothetical protein
MNGYIFVHILTRCFDLLKLVLFCFFTTSFTLNETLPGQAVLNVKPSCP